MDCYIIVHEKDFYLIVICNVYVNSKKAWPGAVK